MTEEIAHNIYRIGVPLTGNPLKELNSYFIRGKDRDLLIDTGFRNQECFDVLTGELKKLGSDIARRNVLLTHMHADHSGMADLVAGEERKIYISEKDRSYMQNFMRGQMRRWQEDRYTKEGMPHELVLDVFNTNPSRQQAMKSLDSRFTALNDGDHIEVGEYRLEAIYTEGHTPGSMIFYIRDKQIMFTGDHVLFDITPNITIWPYVDDSLGSYLENLQRVRNFDVKLALPGHRKTGDYRGRIDTLSGHHAERLAEALAIVSADPGSCGYDIAGRMKWKIRADSWETFPKVQKWFALGECLSHLDHLIRTGEIKKKAENGIWRYYAV
ncbi:MAG: MBL fold metallo-hydrolase [Eubacteriaceae bacterium]|jgi:glyoxylase-like metal-dependent hydrolase (beta-lactamase superfamily II)|nr:MBL fold metallo-hydrolase [Eubacteriaceae bacterium]